MKSVFAAAAAVGLVFGVGSGAGSAADTRVEQIALPSGAGTAVVAGRITGEQTVDYVLSADEGQYVSVGMTSDHDANHFDILPPNGESAAMFVGSTHGHLFNGILPQSGEYTVRVYLLRGAARRDETADYRLDMLVTDADSALRAGLEEYDARGLIRCARHAGQPMRQCDFGVAREGGGRVTVVVTHPDGRTRALVFVDGEFNSAYARRIDSRPAYEAERDGDLHVVSVGEERYEVPHAIIQADAPMPRAPSQLSVVDGAE